MQTITIDTPIEVPTSLVVCPICQARVTVEIDEWEENDNGEWQAGECGVHVNCITEPDMDEDDSNGWNDWFDGHWQQPYIDWLPVEDKVKEWLNKNYRFEMRHE